MGLFSRRWGYGRDIDALQILKIALQAGKEREMPWLSPSPILQSVTIAFQWLNQPDAIWHWSAGATYSHKIAKLKKSEEWGCSPELSPWGRLSLSLLCSLNSAPSFYSPDLLGCVFCVYKSVFLNRLCNSKGLDNGLFILAFSVPGIIHST